MSRKILILVILFLVLVLYYLPEIYRTALVIMGWTEMNTTVRPSQYLYDIVIECQEGTVNQNQYASANISVTNNGIFEGDVQVDFWIEDVIETTYSSGSNVINILQDQTWSSTKSLLVPSSASTGTYYFKVNVSVATYSSTAFCTFKVQTPVTTTISITGGGGGSPIKSVTKPEEKPNIDAIYLSNHIVIPGIPKEYDIEIKNSGNVVLSNLTLYLQGLELDWYSIHPKKTDLEINETVIFKINYTVPSYAEIKKYPIIISIKSDEVGKTIHIRFNVIKILEKSEFGEKREEIEKKIEDLEKQLLELEKRGISISALERFLYNAKEKLELAKIEVELGNLIKASELIYEVEISADVLEEMVDKYMAEITPIRTIIVWSTLLATIIIVVVFMLSVKFVEKQIKNLSKYIGRIKL